MDGRDSARKPWFKRFWGISLIALGGLMGIFVILTVIAGVVYAVAGGEALESTGVTAEPEATTTTLAPTTTTTLAPMSTTIATTTTTQGPTSTTVAAKESEPANASGHNLDGPWTMPNLIGENLQDAQDIIQSISYGGILVTFSHDATEDERTQVLDGGWMVCDQSIPAGESLTRESLIDFGVVRVFETCP